MDIHATIEEAINEARRQSEEQVEEAEESRNLVFKTQDGYGARTVANSDVSEFGSEYELLGEIVGRGGEYWEYDREVLRENGLRVSD
jgi:hypothetical protein